MTSAWKEARKQKNKEASLGHLVKASFQELASIPMHFNQAAKLRSLAYLEFYLLQEALGNSLGKGPQGHQEEYNHRVKVALDQELAAKKEAYRIADYRLSFLLLGAKKEGSTFDHPAWAPASLQQQLKTLGPKIRQAPLQFMMLLAMI